MRIIVDAMGGDNAPLAPVEGALQAAQELDLSIILTGDQAAVSGALAQLGQKELPRGVELFPTTQVIEMEDNPARAFRDKPDSSMTRGLELLRDGKGDAFVSAGSTGALLSGATLVVKRIRGIRRAALAPVIPNSKGHMVLIDCGATADCTPEYLLQYAFMGSYYDKKVLGVPDPGVALLNIGVEPGKGLDLQRQAYALLEQAGAEGRIRFIGNIEAREALSEGKADVLVTDGFTGNIFLKTVEGSALTFNKALKELFLSGVQTKMAAAMLKNGLIQFKKRFDSSEVGGTAMLGIAKPVIKAHGSSNAYAFLNAIRQAAEVSRSAILQDIAENVEHMRIPNRGTDQ